MDFETKSREFDRQIKEARRAAQYALTLEEKLSAISRVKQLTENKILFRKNSLTNPEK